METRTIILYSSISSDLVALARSDHSPLTEPYRIPAITIIKLCATNCFMCDESPIFGLMHYGLEKVGNFWSKSYSITCKLRNARPIYLLKQCREIWALVQGWVQWWIMISTMYNLPILRSKLDPQFINVLCSRVPFINRIILKSEHTFSP
jgi:hypothetical protein